MYFPQFLAAALVALSLAFMTAPLHAQDEQPQAPTSDVLNAQGDAAKAAENYAEARRLYQQAVDLGDTFAMRKMGHMHLHGHGVEQDYAEARRWYDRALEAGDVKAANDIGLAYTFGHGVEQDYAEGFRWVSRGAQAGDPVAMANLGIFYDSGYSVKEDDAQAAYWYVQAMRGGNHNFGEVLKHALPNEAATLHAGLQQALRDIGVYEGPINGEDQAATRAAIEALLAQTPRGSRLGGDPIIIDQGEGAEARGDYAEARRLYEDAVNDSNNARAMRRLGRLYRNGHGVEQDYAEAMRWYRRAAELGDSMAQGNLGDLYLNGHGVEQDYNRAMSLYIQALRGESEETRVRLKQEVADWPLAAREALQQALRDAGVYNGPVHGEMDDAALAAINAVFGEVQ